MWVIRSQIKTLANCVGIGYKYFSLLLQCLTCNNEEHKVVWGIVSVRLSKGCEIRKKKTFIDVIRTLAIKRNEWVLHF